MKLNNETKVGIMAAVAITLLVLGFNLLKGEKIFVGGFELKSYYMDVAGLAKGNPVIYHGFRVGQVKSIEIDDETGEFEVKFSLKKGLHIPIDSKAEITDADLFGTKAIEVHRGKDKEMVDNGGVLVGTVKETLTERIEREILPLKDDLGDLIKQMERFMGWLNNTMDESAGNKIDNILDGFETTSKNLARTTYRVDTLLASMHSATNNVNRFMRTLRDQGETIDRIMGNAAQFTDSLAAASSSVKDIVEKGSNAVADFSDVLTGIKEGKGSLGKLVNDDELYINLNRDSKRLDSLLTKFQNEPIPLEHHIIFGDREAKEKAKEDKRLEKEKRKIRRQNKDK